MRTAFVMLHALRASGCSLVATILSIGLWLPAPSALALEQLRVELGNLAGDGWRAEGVRLEYNLDGAAQLQAQRIVLPAPVGELRGVRVACRQLKSGPDELLCPNGSLQARASPLGSGPMPISFRYRLGDRNAHLTLRKAQYAGGELDLSLESQREQWRLRLDGRRQDAAALAQQLPGLSLPDGFQLNARLDLQLDARGHADQVQQVTARVQAADVAFASADGSKAAEQLALQLDLDATSNGPDWRFDGTAAGARGTVCSGSCWELPAQPVTLKFQGQWLGQQQRLELTHFQFQDVGVLQAEGKAQLPFAPTPATGHYGFDLRLDSADAERLYARYLQPLLIGSALEALQVQGQLSAHLQRSSAGSLAIGAELRQLSFADAKQRFGLRGLSGHLSWREDGTPQANTLRWQAGNLYQIPVGASSLQFETSSEELRLTTPASVPVFDGSLEIARFSLAQPGTERMAWHVDAVLTPVAMKDFSRAMGWPEMAGQLSGVIPELHYADQRLTVDGVLLIRAFDGDITIRNLQVDHLLGVVPTLNADVQLRDIDLQKFTGTFSFGRIEGRLEGAMNGLELQNWRPVAFQAHFETPRNDDSRHRISQRAVDNLTSLGGGVGGALSRSFLRFFEDFSYDRLGLSCVLKNGVCEMGGVEPAPNGYYIVKGGGLPRIDVIGYQRRVNWPVLIKRLEAITSGGGPVIR